MQPVSPSYLLYDSKCLVWCPTCKRNVNYDTATGDPLDKLLESVQGS